jgi:hypothetical protein
MIEHRYWMSALVMLVVTARPPAEAATTRVAAQANPAGTSPRLTVFGIPQANATGHVLASKLDGSLAEISQRYATIPADQPLSSLHAINPAARFRLSAPLTTPEVSIDAITTGDPQALKSALQNLGLRDAAVFSNDVGGWLPVDQLASAGALTELHFARAAMPHTRSGVVATQGDFAQRSSVVRTTYPGLTGAGVTVGVLSDSFNCYQTYANNGVPASGLDGYASNGFTATYASDQSSGALPAGVNVLEGGEAACLQYGAPEQLPFTDEGRAILQIVHAVAPGASLAFYTAVNNEADFAAGIVKLANAGAKVIDDDIGYPDEPFFQDGVVAQAINQVAAQGVVYFSSAGNDSRNSYENLSPSFPVVATSAPNTGEKLLNFDQTGATTATSLPLTIPALFPGEFISLVIEWDQPYVTGAPTSAGASSSLDLCITGAGTDQVTDLSNYPNTVSCTGPNNIHADPLQVLLIGNPASARGNTSPVNVSISIGLANGTPAPGLIKFLLGANGAPATINSFATNSPTIQGHPSAAGAAAVGAAFYFDTPACGRSPATLEPFSSAGGDPILFDETGTRMASPQMRLKPDFVGPDGTNNTFLGDYLKNFGYTVNTTIAGCENDASLPNFLGTSAAAPHAAAAAALMLQANPALTPAQIFSALRSTALAMGSGVNNDDGNGFIQIDAALAQLPMGAPSISVSPASVTLGSSASLTWAAVNSTSCTASGSWSGTQAVSGNQSVTPTVVGTNTYTLSCTGAGGSTTNSATLTVDAQSSASAVGSVSGTSSGGGGGGSLDEITLLALSGMLLMRWLAGAVTLGAQESHAAFVSCASSSPKGMSTTSPRRGNAARCRPMGSFSTMSGRTHYGCRWRGQPR